MSDRDPAHDAMVAEAYGFTAQDAPRYSMWKPPGHTVGSAFMETDADGSMTWRVNIHNDALGEAVAAYLERHGAPVFSDARARKAYVAELERQLRAGLAPVTARDAALRATHLARHETATTPTR